jgi:hypothetical protein
MANEALYWLEADQPSGKPRRLLMLPFDGDRPRSVLSNVEVRSFSVTGEDVYYIEQKGSSVKRVKATGGDPTIVIDHATNPGEVYADANHLYWTETAPASLASVTHIPIAHDLTEIHQARHDGSLSRVLAITESTGQIFNGRILLSRQNGLYWAEWNERGQGRTTTALKKSSVPDGKVTLLSVGVGRREYLPVGEYLYCVAESVEGTPPGQFVCIRRVPLKGGEEETLTDWLDFSGTLVTDNGRVYYLHRHRVWEIPANGPAPANLTMRIADGELGCYLHDGRLFSYSQPIVTKPTLLHEQPLRPRGSLLRAFGLGM